MNTRISCGHSFSAAYSHPAGISDNKEAIESIMVHSEKAWFIRTFPIHHEAAASKSTLSKRIQHKKNRGGVYGAAGARRK